MSSLFCVTRKKYNIYWKDVVLKALDLHIVAEGVETKEMNEQLAQIGCHYMQGWYYSKAIVDQEFMRLVNEQ